MSASRAQAAGNLRGAVSIDGSSTVYPITEAVAEEFRKVEPNVRVTVGISGTGGGFKRFAGNETDISDASRPIKEKELAECEKNKVEFIEVPVAYDGLTIVVNKANDWVTDMSVADLKKIFLAGQAVKSWKDVNPKYPDTPIKIYAPGTDSGTFDYFKEVVASKGDSIRGDMSVSEDDNVLVRGVSGEKGAIGFFGCAYYFENRDKVRAVSVNGVMPTSQTIEEGTYSPFSRPLFIYVKTSSLRRPEVKAFVDFYMDKGPALAEEVGYVKLPSPIYDRAKANIKSRKTGTQYLKDGKAVHGPLTEVYQ
jgi:phosphate transport system substrate-binding protein